MIGDQILVSGGSGKTGSRVAERLSQQGFSVRIGSRSGQPPFSWENRETWDPILMGVRSAYIAYSPDLAFPGAAETVGAFADLAVDRGVQRLVLLSGRGEEGARRAEQAVQNSGAEWTILRSSFFCQNFNESYIADAVLSGELAFPAGAVREPFIDVNDIAELAVAALTEDRHVGKLYEVTGPRLLTFADAVAEISSATGRYIRYNPVTSKRYEEALFRNGFPADFAKSLVDLFATVLDGRNAYLSDGIQSALGRRPRDFSDYAREAAARGGWRLPLL